MARLVYLGSPDFAVPPLEALVSAGHAVALVVSRADARRGRGGRLAATPVADSARRMGLPVSDRLEDVLGAGAELGVVVAYGKIVPAAVLDRLPMVNIHFSLLPRWRGAAPVERAILAGDDDTGVCLMRLEAGLDTGPVLARRRVTMDDDHVGVLTERLARLGADMLVDLLADSDRALGPGRPQVGEPTYASKLEAHELRLDWRQPAPSLRRLVRLDRAWTTFRGRRLRVVDALVVDEDQRPARVAPGTLDGTKVWAGSGALRLHTVVPEGRRPLDAGEWVRGVRPAPGERLGDEAPPGRLA